MRPYCSLYRVISERLSRTREWTACSVGAEYVAVTDPKKLWGREEIYWTHRKVSRCRNCARVKIEAVDSCILRHTQTWKTTSNGTCGPQNGKNRPTHCIVCAALSVLHEQVLQQHFSPSSNYVISSLSRAVTSHSLEAFEAVNGALRWDKCPFPRRVLLGGIRCKKQSRSPFVSDILIIEMPGAQYVVCPVS